ncbi:MAG: GNAT family N-acetyltransferase [Thermodesulfobacteriota bacterium]|nr:GNAT family N-acetyltransferase [Thermodesulfobacteriota bacterium]
MKIRGIEKKDRPALKTILKAQEHFRPAEVQVALELIDIALTKPDQQDYIIGLAEGDDGEILGYICYGKAPMTDAVYDLYWIVVHPAFWNQGTGTFLLRHAEKDLMRRQARLILIETSSLPPFASPRAFYQKHDYRELARVTDYYAAGDHKLIFGKTITH